VYYTGLSWTPSPRQPAEAKPNLSQLCRLSSVSLKLSPLGKAGPTQLIILTLLLAKNFYCFSKESVHFKFLFTNQSRFSLKLHACMEMKWSAFLFLSKNKIL
jgi:hypothetical protein